VVNLIFNSFNPLNYEQLNSHPYLAQSSNYSFSLFPYQASESYVNEGNLPIAGGLEEKLASKDPLDSFLGSKKESLTESAKAIVGQIYERLSIRDLNFYEIDWRISRANSVIDTLDVFELGALEVVDKRKANFQKEIIDFEQEKRFERVACWRDVSRLKTELMEIKQQLDIQSSREKLING
jgi:hypothetical protein